MVKLSLKSGISALSLVSLALAISPVLADFNAAAMQGIGVTVSDGVDWIAPGGTLVYVVTVQANNIPSQNIDVSLNLPSYVNRVNPSDGGLQVGNTIIWRGAYLTSGQARTFSVQVSLLPNIQDLTRLIATAQAGTDQATDATIVQYGATVNRTFRTAVTASQKIVYPGNPLSFTVNVTNTSAFPQTTDVNMTLSNQMVISNIQPPAPIYTPTLVWPALTFGPNETKSFTISGTAQKHVSPYVAINLRASANGSSAVDTVTIFPYRTVVDTTPQPPVQEVQPPVSAGSRTVLFREVAQTSEVIPGTNVGYTLYVQNLQSKPINGAAVSIRFDPSAQSIVDDAGASIGGSSLTWTLPTLQPGQIWRVVYTMHINSSVTNGPQINTVATISGNDVGSASLNELVTVSSASVMGSGSLPTTGAAFDMLFVLMTAGVSAAGAIAQRRFA